MLTTYGVLGTGSTSKNVIEDALNELGEDNDYLLYGSHKMSGSEARVCDWLTNHEVPCTIVHDGKTSATMMESGDHFIDCKDLNAVEFLKQLKKRKGTLLLLWDDERIDEMEEIVFKATDLGIEIKDLTNGLTPIVVEGSEEEPAEKPAPVQVDEVEIEPFSRKELEEMPITVLRKNAKNHGITTDGLSKAQLVDALLGEDGEEAPAPVESSITATVPSVQYSAPARAHIETDDEKECMATIVLPNGTIVSTPITMAEAKMILGLG
jgi:hypothetical protein